MFLTRFHYAHAPSITVHNDKIVLVFQARLTSKSPQGLWISIFEDNRWFDPEPLIEDSHYDCWNPVWYATLTQLWLYFKTAKPSKGPSAWQGELLIFNDNLSHYQRHLLPDVMLGPTKNQPIESNGYLLIPSSRETWNRRYSVIERIDMHSGQVDCIRLETPKAEIMTIQPALLTFPDSIVALTRSNSGVIYRSDCFDKTGEHWTPLYPTNLPNPNSAICAINWDQSGYALAYNPSPTSRNQLAVSLITWEGIIRQTAFLPEKNKPIAYPCLIKRDNSSFWLAYSIHQRIISVESVEISPEKIRSKH